MMKIEEVIEVTTRCIPRDIAWEAKEAYGPYNIVPQSEVHRALYCVTPTREVVKYAKENKYDLLISHHPFVVSGIPQLIFHTALDCCEGGLNDMWRDALGVQGPQHFDGTLGWFGDIEPIAVEDLKQKIMDFCGNCIGEVYIKEGFNRQVKSVVICTGLGGMVTELAAATKADCYILGELCSKGEDTTFNSVIEVGHTFSEWIGVHLFRKILPQITVDSAPFNLDYYGGETFAGNS